jgi:hypothetical protein
LRNDDAMLVAARRRCDLVEQGLKLMVVVLVDQRDVDRVLAGELTRAAETREAAANDHDMPVRLSVGWVRSARCHAKPPIYSD